jgi:formamidopyrimidine-DNA glycosylase
MTGRLVLERAAQRAAKHLHLEIRLAGLKEALRFYDPRRFGRVALGRREELSRCCGLGSLGLEPLEGSAAEIARALGARAKRLKALLLEQTAVAGLGNIYADEALWRSRLHPERVASTLSAAEALDLARHIRRVLGEAVRHRGSSVDDYVDGSGRPGSFQNCLRVYGREGLPCKRCGAKIVRLQIAGRSTHICPQCQRRRPEALTRRRAPGPPTAVLEEDSWPSAGISFSCPRSDQNRHVTPAKMRLPVRSWPETNSKLLVSSRVKARLTVSRSQGVHSAPREYSVAISGCSRESSRRSRSAATQKRRSSRT